MIHSEVQKISSCKQELTLRIGKEDLDPIREQQTKRVRKEVEFPGFRKGKAPIQLVKQRYSDVIEAYTMEAAVDQALRETIDEKELAVLGTPEAKKMDKTDEGGIETVIEFETYPEIEFKQYTGFDLTKDKYEVSDEHVNETLERLRREKADVYSVEGPIEKDHTVHMDMQELDESGVPIVGHKYENMKVRIGEGKFDPDLEEQLIGLKKGQEKDVEKVYPEDFPQKEYAGKRENYRVKINEIQEEELPELNDDFAKEYGEDIEKLDEFKKRIRERLEAEYSNQAEQRFIADLSQALLEANPFDLPTAMVERYLDNIVKDVQKQDSRASEDEIKQHYRNEAEFNLKWHYFREELAKKEGIEVTEEDVKTFLDKLENEKVREFYENNPSMLERAKDDIRLQKVVDFLRENNNITENEIKV